MKNKHIQHMSQQNRLVETDRRGLRSPAGRTHLTVGFHELECLHQPKGLLYGTAHRQVVDAHVFHHAAGVDNEQSPGGKFRF